MHSEKFLGQEAKERKEGEDLEFYDERTSKKTETFRQDGILCFHGLSTTVKETVLC